MKIIYAANRRNPHELLPTIVGNFSQAIALFKQWYAANPTATRIQIITPPRKKGNRELHCILNINELL